MTKLPVGGQAVMEGVMMKSPNYIVTSVRKPNGKITSHSFKLLRFRKFFKLPFIRGIATLFEMLIIGIQELTWSANQVEEGEDEQLGVKEIFFTLFSSFAIAVLVFFALPILLTRLITQGAGVYFSLIEGAIRISLFLLYIYAISFMDDVKALFQYHGAEHKSVHCYEHGEQLTVKNVRKYTTIHTRCGSAFIGIVLMVGILLFSFIQYDTLVPRLISKVILLPIVASLSYELLKIQDRFKKNIFFKILIYPGIFFQKITTAEPNDKQIAVAIHSLKKALNMEKKLNEV